MLLAVDGSCVVVVWCSLLIVGYCCLLLMVAIVGVCYWSWCCFVLCVVASVVDDRCVVVVDFCWCLLLVF